MKPVTSTIKVESRGLQNTVKFGIKSSGLHHILGILRNQLYSDKVLAVIREYSCNGVDAHTQAGKADKPIEVTLPNRLNPYFKVRDFGEALTDQEIQDVYAFYGESTKRNSNDQIGMLGIGSKSAFAYGDNFVINSYINGTKRMWNAFIDETQIGQISKIGEEKTDEENGIEIVVPTKEADIEEFSQKAKDLFEHFKVMPIVKGVKQFDYDEHPILFTGTGWKWRDVKSQSSYHHGNSGEAVAVMGNIGYPIDEYSLNLKGDDERKLDTLLCQNLELEVEIGDLEISASREKLQYTDYTRKQIIEKLLNVQNELLKTVGKQFKESKTLFDAKCLYGSVFDYGSPLYALRDVLSKELKWNGKAIEDNTFKAWLDNPNDHYEELASCVKFTQGHSRRFNTSGRYKTEQCRHINCEKNVVVIENDCGHNRGIMGRILPLIFDEKKTPLLMKFKDAEAKKKWLEKSGFDAPMTKLSSLDKRPLNDFYGSNASTGISYDKDEKHSAKCFEFDFKDAPNRSYHTKKSDFWKIAKLDVEKKSGVYVILDKFQIERKNKGEYASHDSPNTIKTLKESLEQVGVKFPKHVYAFKVKERAKIEDKDGWIDLNTWAKQQLEEVIANANLHQAWIDIQKIEELNNWKESGESYYSSTTEAATKFLHNVAGSLVAPNGTLSVFLTKHAQMRQGKKIRNKIKAVKEIAKRYDVEFSCPKDVTATYDIISLWKEVLKRYEMLSIIGRDVWNGYEEARGKGTKIANYVNVIDVCDAAKKP
jgi:hypothetical protein